ncbi:MAG: AMP-binding protein, partial [Promethearchaeota archaeon]
MAEEVYASRFWKKNWDSNVHDIDPKEFETTYVKEIERTFKEVPDKVAMAFQGLEITYGALDKYANSLANALIDHGFKKGDVVAVNLPNIPEYVIALVGILRAGCILSGVS